MVLVHTCISTRRASEAQCCTDPDLYTAWKFDPVRELNKWISWHSTDWWTCWAGHWARHLYRSLLSLQCHLPLWQGGLAGQIASTPRMHKGVTAILMGGGGNLRRGDCSSRQNTLWYRNIQKKKSTIIFQWFCCSIKVYNRGRHFPVTISQACSSGPTALSCSLLFLFF